ncbi:MAG: bifunctional transaldolase/phosoglucose isomerase, partial [Rhizobacter sp.]|nr:bifunctional transaldolase/phosoglucose isomerase [Chlorobiales bacterium]
MPNQSNPLLALKPFGQSIWYDNLRRGLVSSGELGRMIKDDGLMGVTSNPTIFEKAIAGSTDYLPALTALVEGGTKHTDDIYESLVVEDLKMTTDLFRPVYDATNGIDGYVSVEVSPLLAHKTEETIAAAKRFHKLIGKPNVMIKIPATPEGIPAVKEVIRAGINVNITLIFSTEQYIEVALAYIEGLEARLNDGKKIDNIASVASVFVSRIDVAVDALLEEKIKAGAKQLEGLLGKAAIANARATYSAFKELFYGERFKALRDAGAKVQRPLWASTGTKNPKYSDVMYMNALIGPDTVNTVPPATLDAFRDHGTAANTLDGHIDEAKQILNDLASNGIDLSAVYAKLLQEGLASFSKSFGTLYDVVRGRKQALLQKLEHRQTLELGKYAKAVKATAEKFKSEKAVERFWKKDATVWKNDDATAKVVKNRMGWIPVIDMMQEKSNELKSFAEEIRKEKFTDIVVLGMGGSSLCPDVFRATFGSKKGFPKLSVLDSTDPVQVLALEKQIKLEKTLFIVASKSGGTLEPQLFFEYFYDKVSNLKKHKQAELAGSNGHAAEDSGGNAGEQFIAITDPDTKMHKTAQDYGFRRIFLNPADIGGRYSALSYFGLVPAALIGMDVELLLERAERMVHANAPFLNIEDNPAVMLGIALGELAKAGRNKVTFVASPKISTFGYWVEQLIAESTGKEGRGLVPVEGETLGTPKVYGKDRVFVSVQLRKQKSPAIDSKLKALEKAGHPVVRIVLEDVYDLGTEMMRWELATSFASAVLQTNPYDEPNVQESKDNTVRVTNDYEKNGTLPQEMPIVSEKGMEIFADAEMGAKVLKKVKKKTSTAE